MFAANVSLAANSILAASSILAVDTLLVAGTQTPRLADNIIANNNVPPRHGARKSHIHFTVTHNEREPEETGKQRTME